MRIPIFINREPMAAALLIEGDASASEGSYVVRFDLPQSRHFTGCSCCAPRGPVAAALAAMFRARAMGTAPFFQCVILRASAAGLSSVKSALAEDAVTGARYYLATE